MRVIITDGWPARYKPVYLTSWMLWLAFFMLLLFGSAIGFGVYRVATEFWAAQLQALQIGIVQAEESDSTKRWDMEVLAKKVGIMQGQLIQLDALAHRVSDAVGVDTAELDEKNGQGGLLEHAQSMTTKDLLGYLADLEHSVQDTSDIFILSQARISEQSLGTLTQPSQHPVPKARISSGFGWRIDPFTGRKALHKGLDFAGRLGTQVLAAAGGVVVKVVKSRVDFGNYIEIDHGNGLMTRYAHLLHSHVLPGDLVKKGQHIADLGNSGRSTGPHLHFEVSVNGNLVNPKRFLFAKTKKKAKGKRKRS